MLAGPARMKTWIGPAWTGSGSGFIDEFATPTQVSISSASVRLCTRRGNAHGVLSVLRDFSRHTGRVLRRTEGRAANGHDRKGAARLAWCARIRADRAEACSAAGCIYLAASCTARVAESEPVQSARGVWSDWSPVRRQANAGGSCANPYVQSGREVQVEKAQVGFRTCEGMHAEEMGE